jgi:hypothetical protein
LRKELKWLQKGRYSEFSWQSMFYYTNTQQITMLYPQGEDLELQQQHRHEAVLSSVGFCPGTRVSSPVAKGPTRIDVAVYEHVDKHEYIFLESSAVKVFKARNQRAPLSLFTLQQITTLLACPVPPRPTEAWHNDQQ